MSFLAKLSSAAAKASNQAQTFSIQLLDQAEHTFQSGKEGFSLEKECNKSAEILKSFLADPDSPESALNSIPKSVLQNAKGFAIFTVLKAGFVWSGKLGSGIVIARLDDGSFSAPSCIATGGVGFGLQIGAELAEIVIVLNSKEAVDAFAAGGNVTVGGNLAASIGPIGVGGGVQAALTNPSPLFAYSKQRGLFAGVSLEGTVLIERKDANQAFYGQEIPARDLLSGKIPSPEAASQLYEAIEAAEAGAPTSREAYTVPSGEELFDVGKE